MSGDIIRISNQFLADYLRHLAKDAIEIDRSSMSVEEKMLAYFNLVSTRLLTILPKEECVE